MNACARMLNTLCCGQKRKSLAWLAISATSAGCFANLAWAADSAMPGELEYVIVTAQKRSERLQDVPVPVTAVDSAALVGQNQVQIRDYFTQVPGLNVVPSIQSNQTLSIRGITTGVGNPTVGVLVDGVPYGSSTNLGGGRVVPDIDPGDLARIEVLRGPQGTLYGANSLGGLLNFVTRDPSSEQVDGRVQVGSSRVKNGDDVGYNVRSSINLPVGETLAIRASGFSRRDPGYIDDPVHGREDINEVDVDGGRLSVLWVLSDTMSLKLGALFQKSEATGVADDDIALGDLQQDRLPGTGGYDRKIQSYSATFVTELGQGELTSLSGYSRNDANTNFDFSYAYGGLTQAAFGVRGAPLVTNLSSDKFTQEIRFSSPLGNKLEFLAGGFYTTEEADLISSVWAVNPATLALQGRYLQLVEPNTFDEIAAFANLTYQVSDRFDIQVGGRQSEIEQSYALTSTNVAGGQTVTPKRETEASAFTYLVTPRFKVTQDTMVYARFASGYRAGGPNPVPGGIVSTQYKPDKTRNYELGLKSDFFNRALSLDASVYYIDWKDIQFNSLTPTSTTYTSNGSRAKSQGIELAIQAVPADGFTVGGWVAWSDAALTEPFPAGSTSYGVSGARLPNSSRFSGNLVLDQEIPLGSDWAGFVGATVSYVGDRLSTFRGLSAGVPLPRQMFPSYTRADLRLGIKNDAWSANIFCTNVTDERGVIYGGAGANPPTAFTYIQPRTLGLSLEKTF